MEGRRQGRDLRPSPYALWGGVAVAVASFAVSKPCAADPLTKQMCLTASDKAQQLRLEGKLRGAREQLLLCSHSECPGLVRQDCAQWMNEVITALPSVVIGARDWQGHDVFAVKVSIDGTVIADKLDGKPIEVDPGVHSFTYASDAAPAPLEEQVLVRQGEKNRSLTVTFPAPPNAQPPPPPQPLPPSSVSPSAPEPPPLGPEVSQGPSALAWVFGGLGVAALGGALYADLSANTDVNNLRTSCSPNCSTSSVDNVRTRYTVAAILLGVGIASAGIATYFFIARPAAPASEHKHASIDIDFAPSHGGGTALVSGAF
jgi:hypothetical protein